MIHHQLKSEMNIIPNNDGINHINVYSKGKTELGRWLSNFHQSPFEHPKLGMFQSMEGFWFYCSSGFKDDKLKTLIGIEAKKYGSSLSLIKDDNFDTLIYEGLECKLTQNEYILEACKKNSLPYYHYYVHPNQDIRLDESLFIITLRKVIQYLILFN